MPTDEEKQLSIRVCLPAQIQQGNHIPVLSTSVVTTGTCNLQLRGDVYRQPSYRSR
jgi:hypothetical protein